MITNVDRALAQQIVNAVKDVCGQDINFIDRSGMIFASTAKERIGTFHEIGYEAFHTGKTIEVDSDNSFTGTQRGINLPIYHNQRILAVIGISGEAEKVRKYAHLAERMTRLLIREQEFNAFSRNQDDKKHFMIHSLIGRQEADKDYLKDSLEAFGIDLKKKKRLLLIRLEESRPDRESDSMMEMKIHQMFGTAQLKLYTYDYPNEYLAVMDEECFENYKAFFQKFAADHQEFLKMAVGKACSVYELTNSYHSALTAWKSIASASRSFVVFDELTMEIVLSAMDVKSREEFRRKTISMLSDEETDLIRVYFEEDMSLSETCKRMFVHKNTLQYKLNHIYQKCGFNPRRFQDAVILYLAVKM
ncbi:MAG: sugar diacid recognition domain-containing protein [Eubacteriales bacterium]|nr:sugar diacid recognition domain-containing protein [Eubacteriales bacterium]